MKLEWNGYSARRWPTALCEGGHKVENFFAERRVSRRWNRIFKISSLASRGGIRAAM
jgi:hypothetical protein